MDRPDRVVVDAYTELLGITFTPLAPPPPPGVPGAPGRLYDALDDEASPLTVEPDAE